MSSANVSWKRRRLRRAGVVVAALFAAALSGVGVFAYTEASAYDASMEQVYAIAPGTLTRSTDPAVIARGEHLTSSLAGCRMHACHGPDLSGGHVTEGGPIGSTVTPNVSLLLSAYTDGELERLIRHGVKKDGRTVRFMIADSFNWLPDDDVVAIISYLRTLPAVEHSTGSTQIRTFGKVMDRLGYIPIDIARRIDHEHVGTGPAPSPTAEYGRWIARLCNGCHGPHMSGGKLKGTPPGFPIPLNLTPHETGLAGWTYDDFVKLAETGKRKDGRPLDAFMPVEMLRNMDETERRALWAYLQSLPPVPFGQR